jgi:hypothetical protein
VLPAPVTLNGVGGIRLMATSASVAHYLHAPIILYEAETGADAYVPICVGKMQGIADFGGGDGTLMSAGAVLVDIWFSAGAVTPRGVGIGSSRARVLSVYGSAIHSTIDIEGHYDLYLVGSPGTYDYGHRFRPIIYFAMNKGRVVAVGYSWKQLMLDQTKTRDVPDVRTFCP